MKKGCGTGQLLFLLQSGSDGGYHQSFEYSLKNVLQEASITETSENPSARLWVDAYSADGKITLVNGRNTLDANAIGIGGDFFLFHPLKLITGSYFPVTI